MADDRLKNPDELYLRFDQDRKRQEAIAADQQDEVDLKALESILKRRHRPCFGLSLVANNGCEAEYGHTQNARRKPASTRSGRSSNL